MVSISSLRDSVIPYDEENPGNARYPFFLSAPESAAFWAKHNGCKGKAKREEKYGGSVFLDTYSGGKRNTEVQLYTLVNGSHGWPGRFGRRNSQAARRVVATELMWEFFMRHPRRTSAAKAKSRRGAPVK